MLKNENYLSIQGWMINELKLKGIELIVYAVIYGFSQDGENRFTGSAQYLAEWTGSTKRSVFTALSSLCEKGYIVKEEKVINGVKFCDYYAAEISTVMKKFHGGSEKISSGGDEKISVGGSEKISLHIKGIHTNSFHNKEDNYEDKPSKSKKFIPPTLEEVREYCKERNNRVDPERFIDHYESNGWKVGKNPMKDWKAAVRTWERSQYNSKPSNGNDGGKWYVQPENYDPNALPF